MALIIGLVKSVRISILKNKYCKKSNPEFITTSSGTGQKDTRKNMKLDLDQDRIKNLIKIVSQNQNVCNKNNRQRHIMTTLISYSNDNCA